MTDDVLHGEGFGARLTPWDERALGFRCAEIHLNLTDAPQISSALSRIDAWAVQQGVAYLFGRFTSERAVRQALHQAGFSQVETSLTLVSTRLDKHPRIPASMRTTLAPADDASIETAAAILRREFHHGRFLEDPCVPEIAARRRNENWLRDLHRAGEVQIAYIGEQLVGFHVERVEAVQASAELLLTGVTSGVPGAALPTWVAVLEGLRARGVRSARTTVSAANVGVLTLYSSLGFRPTHSYSGYRKIVAGGIDDQFRHHGL